MNKKRFVAWLAVIGLAGVIASCKALPDKSTMTGAPDKAVPTVATARGDLKDSQAAALLKRRWARASPDLKQLAVLEEQATGVPLIAGNQVTLLFDGPATMRAMMEAAKNAKVSINLETYIFDHDEIGMQVAEILKQ